MIAKLRKLLIDGGIYGFALFQQRINHSLFALLQRLLVVEDFFERRRLFCLRPLASFYANSEAVAGQPGLPGHHC